MPVRPKPSALRASGAWLGSSTLHVALLLLVATAGDRARGERTTVPANEPAQPTAILCVRLGRHRPDAPAPSADPALLGPLTPPPGSSFPEERIPFVWREAEAGPPPPPAPDWADPRLSPLAPEASWGRTAVRGGQRRFPRARAGAARVLAATSPSSASASAPASLSTGDPAPAPPPTDAPARGDGGLGTSRRNGDATTPPSLAGATNRPPPYPARARRAGWEGAVLLDVLVGVDGACRQARILASSGHPVLDEAALRAVKEWRFEPARQAGRPVESHVELPVEFRLR
ncbi:MAG: energy transducer TonB [Planctomycetes bacterium]|nr:energy transducer TonB [Planctomycetota bacterium]